MKIDNFITKVIQSLLKFYQYNDFKVILAKFDTKKPIVVDFDVKIPLNVLSRTPFHNIVTTKFVPPNLGGDPPEPPGGAIITIM